MAEETQLAKLEEVSMEAGGVRLSSLQDASTFCKLVVKSGLAPASLDRPEKVFVALQTGVEAGLSPMAAIRSIYVIKGFPAWKGEAALGLIRKKGYRVSVGVTGEGDKRHGYFQGERDGQAFNVVFSALDAKRAGLGGDNWRKYPDDMLIWRAVSRGAKRYFSDVLMGIDVAEVTREYSTPAREPASLPEPTEDPLFEAES